MNELALFAGAGGGILGGILAGFRTVCAVEKESYCREVLLRRQRDGVLPMFPIWDDVRTFDGRPWRGAVDIVTAGFPCQPFSTARKGAAPGPDDERNLWPETPRIVGEVGPRFVLLENVTHILAFDLFGQIIGELAELGYDAEWCTLRAADIGAPHLRARVWLVAYADGFGRQEGSRGRAKTPAEEWSDAQLGSVLEAWDGEVVAAASGVPHGVPYRVDRLRALGNAQVPRVAQEAWERLRSRI